MRAFPSNKVRKKIPNDDYKDNDDNDDSYADHDDDKTQKMTEIFKCYNSPPTSFADLHNL